jgi:hypothetical protein
LNCAKKVEEIWLSLESKKGVPSSKSKSNIRET